MKMLNRFPAVKLFLKKSLLPYVLWVRSLRYKGNNVYCPCCKGSFSGFIKVGPKREPMLCPRCRSNDRDRFFWLYLEQNRAFLMPGISILHIAPETVFYNLFRKIPGVDYTPADKFILQFGNTYPSDTVYLDIADMPQIPGDRFDFIYCSHVLEYIPDDGKAMRELFRVMKKGSKGIISVPINHGEPQTLEDPSVTDPAEQERLYGDTGHLRYYGEDYDQKVAAAGFRAGFIPVTSYISAELIRKCVINPADVLHLCIKD